MPINQRYIVQGYKALNQQTRSGEKHHGQRDLDHHEHSTHAKHPATNHRARCCQLQRIVQVDF
jgi:hypothetical protein